MNGAERGQNLDQGPKDVACWPVAVEETQLVAVSRCPWVRSGGVSYYCDEYEPKLFHGEYG